MGRNAERDAREAKRRRERMIEEGFRLFAARSIESVPLQQVADAAGVGIATLFKCFQNKANLVIAISAEKWGACWEESLALYGREAMERFNAMQLVTIYADQIIRVYREQPELLRFSGNYKTFICREGVGQEPVRVQTEALAPMEALFHRAYERARTDGSIRTDIPEGEMFVTVAHTLLAVAERYALGLVWADGHTSDHTAELTHLKEMLLRWCAGPGGEQG